MTTESRDLLPHSEHVEHAEHPEATTLFADFRQRQLNIFRERESAPELDESRSEH